MHCVFYRFLLFDKFSCFGADGLAGMYFSWQTQSTSSNCYYWDASIFGGHLKNTYTLLLLLYRSGFRKRRGEKDVEGIEPDSETIHVNKCNDLERDD